MNNWFFAKKKCGSLFIMPKEHIKKSMLQILASDDENHHVKRIIDDRLTSRCRFIN